MPIEPTADRRIKHIAGTTSGASTDLLTTNDVKGKIVVHAYHLTADGAGTVELKNSSATKTGVKPCIAGVPHQRSDVPHGRDNIRTGLFSTDGVNPLTLAITGGVAVTYEIEFSAEGGTIDG